MDAVTNEFSVMRKRHQKAVRSAEEAIDEMMRVLNEVAEKVQARQSTDKQSQLLPEGPPSSADSGGDHDREPIQIERPKATDADQQADEKKRDPMVIDDRNEHGDDCHGEENDEKHAPLETEPKNDPSNTSDEAVLPLLQKLHTCSTNLQASLVSDHKSVGTAINKFGKVIDNVTTTNLSDLCAPSVRLDTSLINDAIASHLFREGMFDVGRSFLLEAGVHLADDHIRPFEQLYHILTAFRQHDLAPAIAWTREKRPFLRYTSSCLEFRLHCLAYLQILHRGDSAAALAYARTHFSSFPEHITTVQKLMTCLLYAKSLESSPYKDLVHPSRRDDIERSLSREYCRAQGLAKDSLLLTVVRCGTKAIPTLLKASRVVSNLKELGIDDALPVEIDVGRDCRFHSIFTCPVSKEEASEITNAPMILPCGHVLSRQSMTLLPRGSSRFKCPYCPMEQSKSDCRELHF